jgi:tetratricopeptide (TPR) repeat protein
MGPIAMAKTTRNRLWLTGIVALAGLAAAVFFLYPWIKLSRLHHLARQALAAGETSQALQWAGLALQLNPSHLELNRLFAEILEAERHPSALLWRARVAQLQTRPEARDCLAWAAAALGQRRLDEAAGALALVAQEERGASHAHLRAGLALGQGRRDQADHWFLEAVRLEPGNPAHDIALATLRLEADDPAVRAEAVRRLETHTADPRHAVPALRALALHDLRHGDTVAHLRRIRQLREISSVSWSDRLLELQGLTQKKDPSASAHLEELQRLASDDARQAAELGAWMIRNGLARECLDWLDRLDTGIQEQPTLQMVRCDALIHQGRLAEMGEYLAQRDWKTLDGLRLSLCARAARAENPEAASELWTKASASAAQLPGMQTLLASWVGAWGWHAEAEQLLENAARGHPSERSQALQLLFERAHAARDTARMFRISSRQLELLPDHPRLQNNHAYLSLLLGIQRPAAIRRAEQLRQAHPHDPTVADTYALACYFAGRPDEGLNVLDAHFPQDPPSPSTALKKWILLKAAGNHTAAQRYRDRAESGNLLPEERRLLESGVK